MKEAIIYQNENGGLVLVSWPDDGRTAQSVADKVVPESTPYKVVQQSALPAQKDLVDAWTYGDTVGVDIPKAKLAAHKKRRAAREAEFRPHDALIAKQIPNMDTSGAEASRQVIRDKYATIQSNIDACTTAEQIQTICNTLVTE